MLCRLGPLLTHLDVSVAPGLGRTRVPALLMVEETEGQGDLTDLLRVTHLICGCCGTDRSLTLGSPSPLHEMGLDLLSGEERPNPGPSGQAWPGVASPEGSSCLLTPWDQLTEKNWPNI